MEKLFADNWLTDPSTFSYSIDFRPPDFVTGDLASSYEFTDPNTFVVHLRQGIHWQDIQPMNGRELTAADVVYHYDRLYGFGDGFTKPSSYYASYAIVTQLISVSDPDPYTVVFKWKSSNPEFILETLEASGPDNSIEAPEAVGLWGNLSDWHHAIGTGPFILTDYVSGSSATLVKNPNYWGSDERHPQNKIPYVNEMKVLVIPDATTALAATRDGKIDFMDGVSLQNAQTLQKTNPEIKQVSLPIGAADAIEPRNDKAPFNDIKVREAMQMAINLQQIATDYYSGTASPDPSSLTSNYMTGWGLPYDQWPQDLKDQYAYNVTQAKALLTAAGYPTGFNTDCVADNAGDMNLLQIVKSEFAAININMSITQMDNVSWTAFVRVGHKDDALAAHPGAGSLGLTYEPLTQIQRFITGNAGNIVVVSDPVFDAFYPTALAATSVDAIKKVLSDANLYVAQQHYEISLLQPASFSVYQPWLKGYTGQTRAISGSSNPFFLGLYGARFWIDQSLK
jgi:peptide/nickel transport system substrate-binding protein